MDKNKIKTFIKKYFILEAAIFAAVILIDLVSKSIAKNALAGGKSVSIIGKMLGFSYTENFGASYGWFAGSDSKNIIFFLVTLFGLAFFGVMFYLARKKKMPLRIAITLMAAGAVGNAVDRMFNADKYGGHAFFSGGVRDFISINLGTSPFQFICNMADIALSVGVVLFAVMYIFFDKDTAKENKPSPETAVTGKSSEETDAEKNHLDTAVSENEGDGKDERTDI